MLSVQIFKSLPTLIFFWSAQVEPDDTAQARAEQLMYGAEEDLPLDYWRDLAEKAGPIFSCYLSLFCVMLRRRCVIG
jgi:hypothetical protein